MDPRLRTEDSDYSNFVCTACPHMDFPDSFRQTHLILGLTNIVLIGELRVYC